MFRFMQRMRIRQTLIPALVLCCAPTPAHAQMPANWTDSIAPFKAIDNVYYVGSAGLTSWLITTPAGHVLLDGGLPENAPLIERNIVRLGFRLRDVKILLNTHAHFDHAGGLAALRRNTQARLFSSAGDRDALERGVYAGAEDRQAWRFPPVAVDSVIADGGTVTLGGVTLTANITPGHTAGCTSWTLPVMADGARHTAIFFCSASVAANRLAPNPQYPGIVADYRRTFERLRAMDADVFFAAHTELFDLNGKRQRLRDGAPNPFIDRTALKTLAATLSTEFEAELARQSGRR